MLGILSGQERIPNFKRGIYRSFAGGSDSKESAWNAGDPNSIPGMRRFPWRREWLPTPVFLPGEFCGQRSLAGYNAWDRKESDTTKQLSLHSLTVILGLFIPHFFKNNLFI